MDTDNQCHISINTVDWLDLVGLGYDPIAYIHSDCPNTSTILSCPEIHGTHWQYDHCDTLCISDLDDRPDDTRM